MIGKKIVAIGTASMSASATAMRSLSTLTKMLIAMSIKLKNVQMLKRFTSSTGEIIMPG